MFSTADSHYLYNLKYKSFFLKTHNKGRLFLTFARRRN